VKSTQILGSISALFLEEKEAFPNSEAALYYFFPIDFLTNNQSQEVLLSVINASQNLTSKRALKHSK